MGKSNLFDITIPTQSNTEPKQEPVQNNTEQNKNDTEPVQDKSGVNTHVSLPYYAGFDFEKLYDIYSISDNGISSIVMRYKNKMYLVDSNNMSNVFHCANEFVSPEVNGKVKNGSYECENLGDDGYDTAEVKELNITPENISKIVFTIYPYSSDAQFSIFFINVDGKVDYYHFGEGGNLELDVLKDYKIKDLKYTCLKDGEIGCEKPQLNLALQDRTTTNLDSFNWD